MFKEMDKKYLVMLGSVVGIVVFLLLSLLILSSCKSSSSYSNIEKKLVKATEKYLKENGLPKEDNKIVVTSEQLVSGGYIRSLDKLKNDGCTATVTAMNNGGVMNYLPNLNCTNYKTITLSDKIIEDQLVTTKDGLYASNGEYVFKGKNVNNYVSFGGKKWRIIKITSAGDIRLIRLDSEGIYVNWDTKFNEETKYHSGENDYETSSLLEHLTEDYKKYKEKNRKHIIPHAVCVGLREKTNITKNLSVDCSKTLANQYVSVINTMDYAAASLDNDCISVLSGSCHNFNYMYTFLSSSWTTIGIRDNTYEVISYSGGSLSATTANESNDYHLVIHVSGNELYKKGDGSIEKPYVIE